MEDKVLINHEKRLFYIGDDISNISMKQVCYALLCMIMDDDTCESAVIGYTREPIRIFINSYGGTIDDMWSLIDIIENSKTPIYTYTTGYAMSAAFKIFLAGHKRYTTKHATFMLHQMRYGTRGKHQDVTEYKDYCDGLDENIREYITSHSKITKKKINDIFSKKQDYYFSATEAVELGVAHKILDEKNLMLV